MSFFWERIICAFFSIPLSHTLNSTNFSPLIEFSQLCPEKPLQFIQKKIITIS